MNKNINILTSKFVKKLFVMMLIGIVITGSTVSVSAKEVPYDTYSYWYDVSSSKKPSSSTPMYQIKKVISSADLSIDPFNSISDVFVSEDGFIYILDGASSKLYVLNQNYEVVNVIDKVLSEKDTYKFEKAKSVYVHNDMIYICDTENARVLLLTYDGKFIDEYLLPDNPVIPDGFNYRPIKVAVDNYGYTYILSDGSYYGALLFDSEKEFLGFYGSNDVSVGVIGAISSAFNRMFVNNKKKSLKATSLPFTFNDICIDSKNFVYTATGFTEVGQEGQIKKLSPGDGSNILKSGSVNFADDYVNTTIELGTAFKQNILSLDVDKYDFIYALDSSYGRIFIYDNNCKLLSAFGGGMKRGTQQGTFASPSALCVYEDEIYVSDSNKNTITIFEETEYGKLFKEAQYLTLNGEYSKAEKKWNKILQMDRNCQFAYSGIALARLSDKDYSVAFKYAKEGYDRQTYAQVFQEVRSKWLADNFWVVIVAFVLIIALIVFIIINSKKKYISIKNDKIKLLFSTLFHPIQSYSLLQEKKLYSWGICIILAIIYYVATVLRILLGGFAFTIYDPDSFNSLIVFVRSTGLIVLWIAVNWAVSTLFSGRGKLVEIASVTCYSLLPIIVGTVVSTILTNFLTPDEGAFISIFYVVTEIYTLLLIVIGTVVIHDYDFKHFIGTTLLTLIGMVIVVFLIVMIYLLIQQAATFLITVYTELKM